MTKYRGIGILLLALLIIAGTLRMFLQLRGDALQHPPVDSLVRSLMARIAVDDASRNTLKKATETLQQARRVPESIGDTPDIIGLPPASSVATVQRPEKTERRKARRFRHHVVSMVYIGSKERYAVVDGRFCTKGTRLRSGDRVRRIRPGSVLVSQQGAQRWFYMKRKMNKDSAS